MHKPFLLFVTIVLIIADTSSTKTPIDCPVQCKCTKSQVDCSRRSIRTVPLDSLSPDTTQLNLLRSDFPRLPNHAFSGLAKLKRLTITKSNIVTIEASAFTGLTSLTSLSLNVNALSNFPVNVFSHLENLTFLDLSSNKFTVIPDIILPPALRKLYLQNNVISSTYIPANLLRKNSKLSRLILNNNKIKKLGADDFLPLDKANLLSLELTQNNITEIHPNSFKPFRRLQIVKLSMNRHIGSQQAVNAILGLSRCTNLQHLHLAYTGLGQLPDSMFSPIASSPMNSLDLSGNSLGFISSEVWHYLPKLLTLKLNAANITNIQFINSSLPRLKSLELGNNQLTEIPQNLPQALKRRLSLSTNRIQRIQLNILDSLTLLEKFDLSKNYIYSVDPEAFQMLGNLKWLNLANNSLEQLEEGFSIGLVNLTRLQLNGQHPKLEKLGVTSLSLPSLRYLDLSDNNLMELFQISRSAPFSTLPMLDILMLSRNSISKLHSTTFIGLRRLRFLFLDSNWIADWQSDVFGHLATSLLTLDLSFNKISVFALSSSPRNSISSLKRLTSVNFTGNPFDCECPNKWPNFYATTTRLTITKLKIYQCATPKEMASKHLVDIWKLPCHSKSPVVKKVKQKLPEFQSSKDNPSPVISKADRTITFPLLNFTSNHVMDCDKKTFSHYLIIGLSASLGLFLLLIIALSVLLFNARKRANNMSTRGSSPDTGIPLRPHHHHHQHSTNNGDNGCYEMAPSTTASPKKSPSHPLLQVEGQNHV